MSNNQFIRSTFFLMLTCLLFVGCSQEKLGNPGEVVVTEDEKENQAISEEDEKNKEAVRAVLESELTVPNEEYNLIVQNIDKKMDEIGGGEVPSDSAEFQAYQDLVKKLYGPYFTDHLYEYLISNNIAFRYQYGFFGFGENVRYKMNVSDIQVTKSENKNTPKHYDFTAQVEYTNNAGEVSEHEVKGTTILSEPGKIGKFEIRDEDGLGEKVSVDRQ